MGGGSGFGEGGEDYKEKEEGLKLHSTTIGDFLAAPYKAKFGDDWKSKYDDIWNEKDRKKKEKLDYLKNQGLEDNMIVEVILKKEATYRSIDGDNVPAFINFETAKDVGRARKSFGEENTLSAYTVFVWNYLEYLSEYYLAIRYSKRDVTEKADEWTRTHNELIEYNAIQKIICYKQDSEDESKVTKIIIEDIPYSTEDFGFGKDSDEDFTE